MPTNIAVVDGVYSAVLAGEDIGAGVIAQRLKLLWGPDGSATVISAATPLPVVLTGALAAGTNVIGAVTQSGVWSMRLQDGAGTLITNTAGALDVNVKTSAVGSTVGTENGTIASGHTNVAEVMAELYTFTGDAGHTRAGAIPYQTDDLDETAEQVKATACIVYGFQWLNTHATLTKYIKCYNHASPTVGGGSPTPTAFKIPMLPGKQGHLWCGPPGIGFTTALSIAATNGFADSDTGAPGTNEIFCTIFRK